jgi:nucleoside-diphosphate-sugar epimerase
MKVCIIGTNGFLSDRIGVYCSNNSIEIVSIGLTPPKKFDASLFIPIDLVSHKINVENVLDADMIIYAAGGGIQSNMKDSISMIYELNVNVPITLLNDLRQSNYQGCFVSFGSYFEIGSTNEMIKISEIELAQSLKEVPNDYCISKRMLTRYVSSIINNPFHHYHFILPTIYGEEESQHRLIPYVINSLKEGKELTFTAGEQVRQYIYIDDAVNILFAAYQKQIDGGIYNISGHEEFTVKEIVKMLHEQFKLKLSESSFGKESRTDEKMKVLLLDGSKLSNALGYRPQYRIIDVCNKY